MAFDFPNTPTLGQEFTPPVGSPTYVWNGSAWVKKPISGGSGGGIPEAPTTGSDYVRNSSAWVLLDWTALDGRPSTFPPSTHIHPQSEVTGLVGDLAAKAPLASPIFTGDPQAPTPATSDNDTSVATTAFVKAQGYLTSVPAQSWTSITGKPTTISGYGITDAYTKTEDDTALALKAPLASPVFTGDPRAPTPTAGDNDTSIATTAFVGAAITAAAATAAPLMDGTAAVGTTTKYAREDHKHPSDTGREPAITAGLTTQYWRGDKTWQTLPLGGGIPEPTSGNNLRNAAGAWVPGVQLGGDTMTGALTAPSVTATGNVVAGNLLVFNNITNFQMGTGGGAAISTGTGLFQLMFGGTAYHQWQSDRIRPVNDNNTYCGISAARWFQVWAGNGTIQTSDEREKHDIRPLDERERAAARKMKELIVAYRWNSTPDNDKRIHIGVIAQRIEELLQAEGLDPNDYAMWRRDELTDYVQPVMDEDGNILEEGYDRPNGQYRYSVDYNQVLAFVIGGL